MSDVNDQDNEFDGEPRKGKEFSPEELDVMAAEVQRDMAEGRGARHFEDVLDEMHSTQAQPKHEPTAEERDNERRAAAEIARQLKRDASEALLSQGLRVWAVFEVPGDGFRAHIKDATGREFEALLSGKALVDAQEQSVLHGGRDVYKRVVDLLVTEALGARAKYFERMRGPEGA